MKKGKKIIILIVGVFILSISTVYAVTIIKASDVIYDNSNSNGSSTNVQGAIDELYDLKGGSSSGSGNKDKLINENMISYITNLAKTDTTNLAYDDTNDKNLRYIGADPNNYVEFNGELWRIIGIKNNILDVNKLRESKIKLIRAESIGDYSFDNKPSGTGSSISNAASSYWNDSRLMSVLNSGAYWNRTSGTCPYDHNSTVANRTTSCDFSNIGLTSEAKSMITNVYWSIGGRNNSAANALTFYSSERSTTVANSRSSLWTGYVGLAYPSDFGYAVGGSVRETCLATNLGAYNQNDCYKNDWLNYDNINYTMTPYTKNTHSVFSIDGNNNWIGEYATVNNYFSVVPTVFLNSGLYITKGKGTKNNPYKISFEKEQLVNNDTSNASPPKLDEEGKLIPVTLADDGKVTYVSENDGNWYNYSDKKWANAVILIDSPSKNYKEGDIISESDIESYFVWIPKYKYKLWNTGTASKKAHEIDIVFDTEDTKDVEGKSCKTPMTSGATGNCNNGEYMTHPAFISLGVNGFWVGKFETGYKDATSTAGAQVSSTDSTKVVIKPNMYSWRSNTVHNMFAVALYYEYNLNSHMMKNTEWGAVTYLSHSKYGINREININNNSSYKTGYSSLANLDQNTYPGTYGDGSSYNQPYNTEIGYLASTTGNITGVYDMSGGAHEYMASYVSSQLGSSGFYQNTIDNYLKYFDVYNANSTSTTYQYRILGDATGEMGPIQSYKDGDGTARYHNSWYNDNSYFVDSSAPWFNRGGSYVHGVLAGQFNFSWNTGGIITSFGSRIVLTA